MLLIIIAITLIRRRMCLQQQEQLIGLLRQADPSQTVWKGVAELCGHGNTNGRTAPVTVYMRWQPARRKRPRWRRRHGEGLRSILRVHSACACVFMHGCVCSFGSADSTCFNRASLDSCSGESADGGHCSKCDPLLTSPGSIWIPSAWQRTKVLFSTHQKKKKKNLKSPHQ